MEVKDIKEQLSLLEVLQHYGLKPDKNSRLHCPFHDDKNPSLQVYPKTNTFCCFSSNCTAGTGDAIQFIQLKEGCTKHEALLKATELITGQAIPAPAKAATLTIEPDSLDRIATLTKAFKSFCKALPLTQRATEYLQSRSLDYKQQEAGFISADWHHVLKEKHFTESCAKQGLLKALPVKGYSVWAKDCIVFPLKNAANKIVSLYGRSTTNNEDSRHFYLAGREGLYPDYPALTTTRLILTESILDAASLLQQKGIKSSYSILSLYGTNGLTDEHQKAIIELPQLTEIILMLNGDEAGEVATAKHYSTLQALLPHVHLTQAKLPDGEDINSVLQAHDDAGVLEALLNERQPFFLSIEKEKPLLTPTPSTPNPPASKLISTNPELLIYDNCELSFEVLGGIKISGLDRLRVTLKVRHKERVSLPQWHSLDLYNQTQREQTIHSLAEALEVGSQQTAQTVAHLIGELESYRLHRIEALQPKEKVRSELTAAQKQQATAELQKPDLLKRTGQLLQQCGIAGEESNSLIAYLVYCTRKQAIPLHVMFLGSSGSGKTYLQEKISELVPEEDKIEITQITENALYYFKQEELKHKLILIEDLDGAMAVLYPLRELQTKRRISKTVTLKDSKGNLKTINLTVEGPVSVSGCTTREKLYEDNANRCLLLYTDGSAAQDKRINDYQTKAAAGEVNKEREQQYKELFRNLQRMLQPVAIINPYAKHIQLPQQVFKPRRTMTLLLGFIEAVTFYHQHQRERKRDSHGQPYIETTVADIESSFELLKEVLFSKSDELTKATRDFLEQLKQLPKGEGDTFSAKSIREQFRINPGNLKRYLAELVRYGYIKTAGNRYRKGSYEYSIVNPAEYQELTSSIEQHLQTILQTIKSSAVVQ